jgi:hypothetical protein
MRVQCAFGCGRDIDPDASSTYRRVIGWERKAVMESRRGGSDITLREALDVYACPTCIGRLKDGVNPMQAALL